jgi:hypothetical protein
MRDVPQMFLSGYRSGDEYWVREAFICLMNNTLFDLENWSTLLEQISYQKKYNFAVVTVIPIADHEFGRHTCSSRQVLFCCANQPFILPLKSFNTCPYI